MMRSQGLGAAVGLAGALFSTTLAAQDSLETDLSARQPINILVFGDVNFDANPPEGENVLFRNGAVDVFMTSRLSARWTGLVELVFETVDGDLITDLERFRVAYEHSDKLRLELGRMHNSIVRWNTTQHHGLYLQTPIDRPALSNWEDFRGYWPSHLVGARASGRLVDSAGLKYELAVGNGRGPILDSIQVASDDNSHKAVTAALGVAPDGVPGLEVFVTGYADRIPALAEPLDEAIVTVATTYLRRRVEIRGEWSFMSHEATSSGRSHDTTGWYLLGSFGLGGRLKGLRPYVLAERVDVAEEDPFLEGAVDEESWTLGVRWDPTHGIAVKGDFKSQRLGRADPDHMVRLQLAVSF